LKLLLLEIGICIWLAGISWIGLVPASGKTNSDMCFGDFSLTISGSHFVNTHSGLEFYIHGVNLPWLDGKYGSYLGLSLPHPEWGVQFNGELMRKRLGQIKSLNANVVRLFLFSDLQGFEVDESGNIKGLSNVFLKNLDDTIGIAHQFGLKIYPVLLDGAINRPDIPLARKLYSDPARLKQFEEKIVRPLVANYRGNSTIFAFDILNESNHELEGGITWKELENLISKTATEIHIADPERLVSCSLIKADDKNLKNLKLHYSELGLDFYDIHQYGNFPNLPNVKGYDLGKPIILGEFGQAEGGGTLGQTRSTKMFLNQTKDRGWNGSLIWALDFPESPKEHKLMNADQTWRPAALIFQSFGSTFVSKASSCE
jgi:endo-1,4-beta-mannosidase